LPGYARKVCQMQLAMPPLVACRAMGNKAAMTKTAHHLDLAIADPLGIITLANPPLNFLSVELLGAIADAVEACDADPRVRVIVLRAQGKTFCAGADLVGGAAGKAGRRPGRDPPPL
jgi:enoyl-CoA hydratase/carnithine racemase